ncbi:MAG TPA: Gfo/Idh/MocA family oxidoreductase [Tepidisphaeraceae bacterium]|jgi:predicted dehydrogenase
MAPDQKILGAAIFGAGWVAGEHAKAYQRCSRTRLIAVGSRKEESARRCADAAGAPEAFITTDFDALLARQDVDVISITTPPDLHADLTIRAAAAGKHICIEKPLTLDYQSCLLMQKAVRQHGVKTVVAFCLHWNSSLMNTRNLLDRGAIGKPYYIQVDYWHGQKKSYPQYSWSLTRAQGGSSLLSAGCHAVDAMRWFAASDEVVEVFAYNIPHQGNNPDWQYPPNTILMCKFQSGMVGKVASSLDCSMPYQFNVDILGTQGSIRDNRLWSEILFPNQTDWATIPAVLPSSGDVSQHPFTGQIEAFAASILDDQPICPDLDDAVRTHELMFAAEKSAATGHPIVLKGSSG